MTSGFRLTVALVLVALIAIGFAMNLLPLGWRDRLGQGLIALPAMAQAAVLAAGTLFFFAMAQDGVAPFIYFQF